MNTNRKTFAAVAAALLLGLAPAASQAADQTSQQLMSAYDQALEKGDVEAATAAWARDGVIRGTSACPRDNPCTGRESIRDRFIKPQAAAGLRIEVIDERWQGDTRLRRQEVRSKIISNIGVERIIVNNSHVVRDGAIQTMENDFDLSDPDTAKFRAAMAKAPPAAGTK